MALVLALLFFGTFATINGLKGKWWMILFSFGLIGIITAIRVAKPGSWWDRNRSSIGDHEKAVKRFTKHADVVTEPVST